VAAAAEGALLGLPSIAVSLAVHHAPFWWETAAAVTRALVEGHETAAVQAGTVLNVNVPNVPIHEIAGYRSARMSPSLYDDLYKPKKGRRGVVKYANVGNFRMSDESEDTDLAAIKAGFVSLTPLMFDLTHAEDLARLRGAIPTLTPLLEAEKDKPASTEAVPGQLRANKRHPLNFVRKLMLRFRRR